MDNVSEVICPYCQAPAPATAYFCPNCGKSLRYKPYSTSVLRQITVYLVSFFLPPSGYWYGWRYFKQADRKAKTVGLVAIILTTASLIIAIWLIQLLLNYINSLSSQINGLIP